MSNPKSPESDVAALVGELLKRHNELLYEKGLIVRRVPSDVELFLDAAIALSSKVKEAGEPGAVAVKPLEWIEPERPDGPVTSGNIGLYYRLKLLSDGVWVNSAANSCGIGEHLTLDEAKAAAQADYETRIRSALLPVAALKDEVDATMAPAHMSNIQAYAWAEGYNAALAAETTEGSSMKEAVLSSRSKIR
jgi:hypothetical protein